MQADEIKPSLYVATERSKPLKSYELGSQVGEKLLVHGDNMMSNEELVKVASRRSRQVGYIRKEIIYKLEDL